MFWEQDQSSGMSSSLSLKGTYARSEEVRYISDVVKKCPKTFNNGDLTIMYSSRFLGTIATLLKWTVLVKSGTLSHHRANEKIQILTPHVSDLRGNQSNIICSILLCIMLCILQELTMYFYNLGASTDKVGQRIATDIPCARGYILHTVPTFGARPPVSKLGGRLARSLKHILAILQVEDWGCHPPVCWRVMQRPLYQLEYPWHSLTLSAAHICLFARSQNTSGLCELHHVSFMLFCCTEQA